MVNQLPKVKIDGKVYFRDDRLQEYRHVINTRSRIKFEDLGNRKAEPVETKQNHPPLQKTRLQ